MFSDLSPFNKVGYIKINHCLWVLTPGPKQNNTYRHYNLSAISSSTEAIIVKTWNSTTYGKFFYFDLTPSSGVQWDNKLLKISLSDSSLASSLTQSSFGPFYPKHVCGAAGF